MLFKFPKPGAATAKWIAQELHSIIESFTLAATSTSAINTNTPKEFVTNYLQS